MENKFIKIENIDLVSPPNFLRDRRANREFQDTLRWISVDLIEHDATHKRQITILKRLLPTSE